MKTTCAFSLLALALLLSAPALGETPSELQPVVGVSAVVPSETATMMALSEAGDLSWLWLSINPACTCSLGCDNYCASQGFSWGYCHYLEGCPTEGDGACVCFL